MPQPCKSMDLTRLIRDVPDFPKPGITFKDITPLLADAKAFAYAVERMAEPVSTMQPTHVLGLESRGFIFGSALAQKTHEPRIRRDQQLVTGLGATGTPAFFINGRKLSGAQPFESFKAVVEEELKKAEALVKVCPPSTKPKGTF